MDQGRAKRAKLNTVISLLGHFVSILCGMVVPSLMIKGYGSEIYGATISIAQFLGYIALIEGGVAGVARAALYGPLAQNDMQKISAVLAQIKRFFRVIAYVFVAYVVVLACSFKYLSDVQALNWLQSFLLVAVISLSTFAQYYLGIANSILIQTSQRTYVTRLIAIGGTSLNTVMIVLLVYLKCDIITVKLLSSCVYVLQPVVMWIYVKKNYKLVPVKKDKEDHLKQRWNALGQHIAYFLHSNTDVAVLMLFAGLKVVAVYSVYNMVITHLRGIIAAFTSGMEALFGDMIAKNEQEQLHKTFGYYEKLISAVSVVLFATTAIMILPFVRLYTAGVEDQNYMAPVFAILIILAELVYCIRLPYHSAIVAAGHFKQTQLGAYGEVLINVGLSLGLVFRFGLVGVAIGTLAATLFRLIFYVIYLSRNIFSRSIGLFVKQQLVNAVAFAGSWAVGALAIRHIPCENYLQWAVCGVVSVSVTAVITCGINLLVYRSDFVRIFKKTKKSNRT